ncbi:MAG: hypothetical protein JNM89_10760 [Hyphomicrobiaceae bacterium]|nr:hypothetical protein [Hyphomicrobiaceae bacterium]
MIANFARAALAALTLTAGIAAQTSGAAAISNSVKFACMTDYFSYCSQHSPEGSGVRQCMRANGLKLSKRCVNALVAAGEVSKEEVARRSAAAN